MPHPGDVIRRRISQRELGLPQISTRSIETQVESCLFPYIRCVRSWNPAKTTDNTHHGGIFNFDFSPDGSLLVAACERKSILLFDPLTGQLLTAKNDAHTDCVNCIRFLDSRTFVSCSDDTTVCVWDVRSLKHNVRTLHGHSNWVKNVEYVHSLGLLVTSGFGGSIYTWDINRYSEGVPQFDKVFHSSGLMRTKLTPDCSKLVIATARGFLMVIHDLDLEHLADDFRHFEPNMYRLRHMNGSMTHTDRGFSHVFTRARNRMQFLNDFPPEDDAEMIASLEVHPQGWCIATRNTCSEEDSEWTCVHDIQDPSDDSSARDSDIRCQPSTSSSDSVSPHAGTSSKTEEKNCVITRRMTRGRRHSMPSSASFLGTSSPHGSSVTSQNHIGRISPTPDSDSSTNSPSLSVHPVHRRIHDNRTCLTHYIEEPNVGRGFIKEIGFNRDGRLICSPFGFGVRLLAFSDTCSELCDCIPERPVQLYELTANMTHTSVVVTTKFSPTHCLLVSGCLSGKVDFHQPVL